MEEGNHQPPNLPPNRLDAILNLFGNGNPQQLPLASYLNQEQASNPQHHARPQQQQQQHQHQHQQQHQQMRQPLLQQQPTENELNRSLLQQFGNQSTRSSQFVGMLPRIVHGISPFALAGLKPDLQSQLLLSLANSETSQNTDLLRALERQILLDRATALNEMEIRRAIDQEREQERGEQGEHLARLQRRHQFDGETQQSQRTPSRLRLTPSMGQSIQAESVVSAITRSSEEASGSQEGADRTQSSVCTMLPFALGEQDGVRDLRMVQDRGWESRFQDLEQFKREQGHCNVPRRYKNSPKLGVWVCSLRQQMSRGTLNRAKIERLNEIGFQWRMNLIKGAQVNPQIAKTCQWDENFQLLASIKERTGKCIVPASERSLCKWVERQRRELNEGKLGYENQEKLNKIGFQ
ncbi:unnamed protein product [Cylindrotheca closterium]|uniref:Helicase-associated domain-containing protein n=1 Tax=Cylindrotheca closterium TaxID=2856 RepID=A0AAD2FJ91_9STRA|nr:unnamed protein product [Cylindrotheca closterium]